MPGDDNNQNFQPSAEPLPDKNRSLPVGDLVRDLLRRAAESGPAPATETPSGSTFRGTGHTPGREDVPRVTGPDPNAMEEEEIAIRCITFWRDGFQFGGGELMRYEDPYNAKILAEIHAGRAVTRASTSILNVNPGQVVELRVVKRTEADFHGGHSDVTCQFESNLSNEVEEKETATSDSLATGLRRRIWHK